MEKKAEDKLNIDQVYENYVNLYLHLDNLRWSFLVGIFALFFGVFSAITQLCHDQRYYHPAIGLCFIIMSGIVYEYNNIIRKFVAGQDYICLFLSDIEERNNHIFSNEVYSPKEGKKFISFFNRRKQSILRDISKHKNSKQVDYRVSSIMQNLLKKGSIILFTIGLFYIILDFCKIPMI